MATTKPEIYLRLVAKTPDGAKALNHIIRQVCGYLDENPYNDPLAMARNEGRRSVGHYIKQSLGEDLFFAVLQTKYE